MTVMVYKWKSFASSVGLSAQTVGEELEKIRIAHKGRLTADDVIAAATSRKHPLHSAFEWKDAVAARSWRLEQAKYLIRSIEVVFEEGEVETPPIRAFVSVEDNDDRSYVSIAEAMSDAVLRKQVLDRAYREIREWQRRYRELTEFAAVFSAIKRVAKKVAKKARARR